MPPSGPQFVNACCREFQYLVDDYGFTAVPLPPERFGVYFQGPRLGVVIRGIQWGSAIKVYLKTGDVEALPEWAAEMDRMKAALARDERDPGETPMMVRKRLDELSFRFELPVFWLFDQRIPGWRSQITQNDQIAQIHEYAQMLRSCAGDLLSGDLSAMPDLLDGFVKHLRQEDILDQQESAEWWAQRQRMPRTAVEEEEIIGKTHNLIRTLHAESRFLLKRLREAPEAVSFNRFAESWQSLAEGLGVKLGAFSLFRDPASCVEIVKELRSAREIAVEVQTILASGRADSVLIEKLAALDRICQEINR